MFSEIIELENEKLLLENDDGFIELHPEDDISAAVDQMAAAQAAQGVPVDQMAAAQAAQGVPVDQMAAAQAAQGVPVDQMAAAQAAQEVPVDQMAAAQAAQGVPVDQMAEPTDQDVYKDVRLDQTQDLYTKVYLAKRISTLHEQISNFIDRLTMKIDTDFQIKIKNINLLLELLDEIALTLPSETLYTLVADLEFELKDILIHYIKGDQNA